MRSGRLAVVLFFLLGFSPLFSESSHVKTFGTDFSLRSYFKYNSFRYILKTTEGPDLEFLSNRPLDIGFGFSFRGFSFRFSLGIPFSYDRRFPRTTSLDLQLQYYGRAFIIDTFVRNYSGLRLSDENVLSGQDSPEVFSAGLFSQVIYEKDKHSLKAAYNLSEIQTLSSGSPLLGGGVFFTSLKPYNPDDDESNHFFYFGPNAGYSYTWVFDNLFFINAGLSMGLHLGIEMSEKSLFFSPSLFPRLALGYHFEHWSWSFSFTGSFFSLVRDTHPGNNYFSDFLFWGRLQLNFVWRLPYFSQ